MAEPDPRARILSALRAHDAKLRRFVAARVPPETVDDVRQEAALRAIEKSGTLQRPERVLPWLFRVHANVAKDALRKSASERRLLQAVEVEVDPVQPIESELCRCCIAQSRQLSPNYSSILDLVDIRGKSLSEAAEALKISVNNATVRLHRARRALKRKMFEHCGVTSAQACSDCRCVYEGCCAG